MKRDDLKAFLEKMHSREPHEVKTSSDATYKVMTTATSRSMLEDAILSRTSESSLRDENKILKLALTFAMRKMGETKIGLSEELLRHSSGDSDITITHSPYKMMYEVTLHEKYSRKRTDEGIDDYASPYPYIPVPEKFKWPTPATPASPDSCDIEPEVIDPVELPECFNLIDVEVVLDD